MTDDLETIIKSQQLEIERLKEDFQQYAYVVSHDFSAPIRQIEGFLNLVHKAISSDIDEKTQEHFDYSFKAIGAARNMLEGMLEYSRIETQADQETNVSLDTSLEKAQKVLEEKMTHSGAKIDSDPLPHLLASPNLMTTLFRVLLDNAITFQPEGNTPKIRISSNVKGNNYYIIVQDNGVGISGESAEKDNTFFQRLFVPLRKGRNGKLSVGPGMGLALAKRITERMGGSISIASRDQETGTIVTLTLPKSVA